MDYLLYGVCGVMMGLGIAMYRLYYDMGKIEICVASIMVELIRSGIIQGLSKGDIAQFDGMQWRFEEDED